MPAQIATSDDLARVEAKLDALLAIVQPPPVWVSVADYAERKGVSKQTVYRWISNGTIEARGSGKSREVRA